MKIGVIMDPIESINIQKDSTFEMLWQAQCLSYDVHYIQPSDLSILQGKAYSCSQKVRVFQNDESWFTLDSTQNNPLSIFDCILMRKDPPFDMEYVYATYVLQLAKEQGCLIVNDPQALRDCNEKAFCAWFPQVCPDTLISKNARQIRHFLDTHQDIILKPLDGMGGASIFRVKQTSVNIGVIIETLTQYGQNFAMAQRYLPAISEGDKRILVIDGTPVPYALARIPAKGETRGNLASGGKGVAQPLSDSDYRIVEAVAPELKRRGIIFAGLDIIGEHLTEINITSPTCIKEINAAYQTNIAYDLFQAIEKRLSRYAK